MQMQRLLSLFRPLHSLQTPFPSLSSLLPSLLCNSRPINHATPPENEYDPPFSPIPIPKNKNLNKPSQTLEPKNQNQNPSKEPNNQKKIPKTPLQTLESKNKKRKLCSAPITLEDGRNLPSSSDLPFDFRYSYSETNPSIEPISFREPRFSPFGPGRLDRRWTGCSAPRDGEVNWERVSEARNRVLGDPLSEEEVEELVERYLHNDCSRQINLGSSNYQHSNPSLRYVIVHKLQSLEFMLNREGKGGVTHNMLDDIHNHWKRAEAVRIKCLGLPTLDMDNVCFHLEDKTGGKIIYRKINILLLYRGRNYDPKERPAIPLMLWKPYAPIYPRLVKNVADDLTFEETKEMRNKGLNSPALMKLTRNGVYVNVVERVREAFEVDEVVRLDCSHVETSDCKKIGVKLRDLVPCVPLLFKSSQIVLWRGKKNEGSTDE